MPFDSQEMETLLHGRLRPLRLRIFEVGPRVPRGKTGARFAVAKDEKNRRYQVILKLREPGTPEGHYKGTSLATELIFAILARTLGLNVPDYAIAEVRSEVATGAPDEATRKLLLRNVGPNFATIRLIPQPAAWDPSCRLLSENLRDAMSGIIAFDSISLNGDRKVSNPNLLWDGADSVHLIDHGLACPVYLWAPDVRERSPLLPDEQLTKHCAHAFLVNKGRRYEILPEQWRRGIDQGILTGIRASIPLEWERQPGDVDAIFDFLLDRHVRLSDISMELRRLLK